MARTILIVDDEPEILKSVGSILMDDCWTSGLGIDGIQVLTRLGIERSHLHKKITYGIKIDIGE